MLTKVRKRLTYANVAMTLAFVLAMSGGAYAAGKYIITSTKQISPKVLKSLTGKAGAKGATGPQGPAGPAGPQGLSGTAGVKGDTGPKGDQGIPGEKGEKGAKGAPGEPWTPNGTLPEGATETGGWSVNIGDAGSASFPNAERTAISFTIPLEKALDETHVKTLPIGQKSTECPGTVEKPEAKAGFLCVYVGASHEMFFEGPVIDPLSAGEEILTQGASTSGAILADAANLTHEAAYASGSWAVTA
jgi:hypothetical protein